MKNVFNPRQLEKNHNIALLFFLKRSLQIVTINFKNKSYYFCSKNYTRSLSFPV